MKEEIYSNEYQPCQHNGGDDSFRLGLLVEFHRKSGKWSQEKRILLY